MNEFSYFVGWMFNVNYLCNSRECFFIYKVMVGDGELFNNFGI